MLRPMPHLRRATLRALAMIVLASAASAGVASAQSTQDYVLDVSGIDSWGFFSDPQNVRRSLNVGANSRVVGLGWMFTQTAFAPSLLSGMTVAIGSSVTAFLGLVGDEFDMFSGTRSYNSGGVLDLTASGSDFFVSNDGQVQFEFFESDNDDIVNGVDGRWTSGTLTLRVEVVPEPASIALTATGLLLLAVAARRRAVSR